MSEIELQDAILRHSLELLRLSAGEQAEADAIMRELIRDLETLLNSRNLSAATKTELKALIAEATKAIDARYAVVAKSVDSHALAIIVAEHTAQIIEPLAAVTVRRVTIQTLASLTKDVLIDGAPSSAWWDKQAEDTAFKFAAQVRQGVINGETNERIVQRIVGKRGEPGIMDVARRNARALVHSSVMNAANDARMATFRANSRFIKGVRWLSTLDSLTCIQCQALDGEAWSLDGDKLAGTTIEFQVPTAHWNCFPGDTLVTTTSRVAGVTKRWFDGEVVVIRTTSDQALTCTPNHPILTDRGWVAAGLLNVGSNVVRYVGSEGPASIDGDSEDVPARIEDVAEAFLASQLVLPVPVPLSAKDFHGDGEGSDVAIVATESLLCGEVDASCSKHGGEVGFIGGGLAGLVPLASCGHAAHSFVADRLAKGGGMGGGDLSLTGGCIHAAPLEALSLGSAPPRDVMLAQDAGYNEAIEAELLGDCVLGNAPNVSTADSFLINDGARPDWYSAMLQFAHDDGVRNPSLAADLSAIQPGQIELDAVVECRRVGFSHYVYNLETESGFYIAQGIVTHNCRCVISGIPKSEPATGPAIGARASSEGPIAVGTTFDDFLKRQSPEFIDKMLGRTRAGLFRQGKITLRDLVSGTGRELTLDQIRTP